ncbi:MAG: putative toxin-antitoxin system toxin component, PIN family [Vicinamibacterales bacterium]
MGAEPPALRVVLDTNTVVSSILFPGGRLGWMRHGWTEGRMLPLVSAATARELIRVLAYPKFKLDEGDIQSVLAAYLPFTETIEATHEVGAARALCSDPDDQMFVDLGMAGRIEALVSGDGALLERNGRLPFAIETAAEFAKRFP